MKASLSIIFILLLNLSCKKCIECSLRKPDGAIEYRNYECGKTHAKDVQNDCESDAKSLTESTGQNYTCSCVNR